MKRRIPAVLVAVACGTALGFFGVFTVCNDGRQDEDVLHLFCFQGYAEPEWIEVFERTHNCTVRYTYTSTIEEMFYRTSQAPHAFDLVSIDQGRIPLYRDAGLLQPIDTDELTNYRRIRPFFKKRHSTGGNDTASHVYHVPIVWGTQTLTVNTRRVPDSILNAHLSQDSLQLSLDILVDPRLKGHTAFFDEAANVFAIAAMHTGVSDPHHLTGTQWDTVQQRIREWAYNAATYTSGLSSEFNTITRGDVWVLLGGNDALLMQRLEEAGLRHLYAQYPVAEGTYCWIDGWSLLHTTSGREKELAYAYMDFMISEQGQRMLARHVGFGPVTESASTALPQATRQEAYWYVEPIEAFPGKLVIMSAEEDPVRRMTAWEAIKAEKNE